MRGNWVCLRGARCPRTGRGTRRAPGNAPTWTLSQGILRAEAGNRESPALLLFSATSIDLMTQESQFLTLHPCQDALGSVFNPQKGLEGQSLSTPTLKTKRDGF